MSGPTRRNVFGLAAGGGLAELLASPQRASAADPPAGELFVMRLFTLGDAVRGYRKRNDFGGPYAIGAGPEDKDLYAELDKCPLYLIDRRDPSDPKKPKFADEEGLPLLVSGGSLRFEFKGKKTSCVVQVAKLDALLNRTTYDDGPPTRELGAAIKLVLSGETRLVSASCTTNMLVDVKYDLTGKLLKG